MTEPYQNDVPRYRPSQGETRGREASRSATSASPSASERLAARAQSLDLDDEVARSLAAIERTVENFGSLKDNMSFYKDMAGDLRQHLQEEKEHTKDARRRLADAERLADSERARADGAEATAAQFAEAVTDLEAQLGKLRSQTARLAKAVSLLLSEKDALSDSDERGLRAMM